MEVRRGIYLVRLMEINKVSILHFLIGQVSHFAVLKTYEGKNKKVAHTN
jgi:hypothetical protein